MENNNNNLKIARFIQRITSIDNCMFIKRRDMRDIAEGIFLSSIKSSGGYLTTPGKAHNYSKNFEMDYETYSQVELIFARFKKVNTILKENYKNDNYFSNKNPVSEIKATIDYGNDESVRDEPIIEHSNSNRFRIKFLEYTIMLKTEDLLHSINNDTLEPYLSDHYIITMEKYHSDYEIDTMEKEEELEM